MVVVRNVIATPLVSKSFIIIIIIVTVTVCTGSVENSCDQTTGLCSCKANVIGLKCDVCRNGYESLVASNPLGCSLCKCYSV